MFTRHLAEALGGERVACEIDELVLRGDAIWLTGGLHALAALTPPVRAATRRAHPLPIDPQRVVRARAAEVLLEERAE